VRHARRAIQELSEGTAGEVRIGTVNSVGIYFLPQLLWTVRERYGATRPTVLYRESDEIVDALLNNHIDLAILADPRIDRRLRYEPLFEERVSLVSGRTNPFFGAPTIRPKQLKTAQFVSLSPQTPTGTLVRRYLERLGIGVEPVVSIENVETVKRMVEIGMGVAFLPDMVTERDIVSQTNPKGRLGRSLVEPSLTRRIVLVTWNEVPSSRAVAAFADEVRRQSSIWPGASIKA